MQPAEEVHSTDQLIQSFQSLNNVQRFLEEKQIEIAKGFDKLPNLYFVHSSKSTESIKIIGLPLFSDCEFFWLDEPMCYNTHEDICKSRLINSRSAINWINSNPHAKGALIEASSGSVWKFRPTPPRVSCDDLFWKRFDRSNVETDFEADVFDYVLDLYVNCEDPTKDPVYSKREDLWHQLLPYYRIYKKRTIHIDELPGSSCEMISFQTVKDAIQKISR